MNEMTSSSRRSFLKIGAVLATPVGVVAVPAIATATDSGEARLAKLENESAIRDLHQHWVRSVNRGGNRDIAAIATDHTGEPDVIQVSADGVRASARYHCVVETVTELMPDCTLTQMKHAQGEHVVRHSARRVVVADYVRGEAGWTVAKVTLA